MVKGLDIFRKYFADYGEQYVLIGGAACDIVFESNEANFGATRDLDMVLIIEALTPQFGEMFWGFIVDGKYRNKATNGGKPQFYRFDKPEDDSFPKMIELFCRTDFELKEVEGITPIHIDDEISSLSAILLNEAYYELLKTGQMMVDGIPVLSPTCLIPFKAKAWLDLKERKLNGEQVDSKNIKKHKNDVFRLAQLITANTRQVLSPEIAEDMKKFLSEIADETVDLKSLGIRGTDKKKMTEMLYQCYGLKDNT